MIIEMIFAAGCGWYGARKLGSIVSSVRSSVATLQGKSPAVSLAEDVVSRLRTQSSDDVRQRAEMLADTPIVAVFEAATPEEKDALVSAYSRYCGRAR